MNKLSTKLGYSLAIFLTILHMIVMFYSLLMAVIRADYEVIVLSVSLLAHPIYMLAILNDGVDRNRE